MWQSTVRVMLFNSDKLGCAQLKFHILLEKIKLKGRSFKNLYSQDADHQSLWLMRERSISGGCFDIPVLKTLLRMDLADIWWCFFSPFTAVERSHQDQLPDSVGVLFVGINPPTITLGQGSVMYTYVFTHIVDNQCIELALHKVIYNDIVNFIWISCHHNKMNRTQIRSMQRG